MHVSLATAALLAALIAAPAAHAADLTLTLTDIRAQTGIIKIGLVNSVEAWNGAAPPVQTTGGPPSGEVQTFTFKDLAPGTYALMITHDENGNGKLDTNALGMPLEGFGFSNNPRVMRKPTFAEAQFTVGADDVVVAVELR